MSEKFSRLVEIMEKLRSEDGCPWDRVQTHDSLKKYLIEETYELIDAIERGDYEAMKEELGDLLLQVVFHSKIAKDSGKFDIDDVIDTISEKMISRHPHVFGSADFKTPEEVLNQWDDRKREEGKLKKSILEGIPSSLPALMRAYKLQSRAAKVGFDWDNIEGVIEKIEEEIRELKDAMKENKKEKIEEELGDLLFSIVNFGRFIKIDPETALRKTNRKFEERFRSLERLAREQGKNLKDLSLDEMDALWNVVKSKERGS